MAAAFDAGGYESALREEALRVRALGGDPFALAGLQAALGETTAALGSLERAVASRSFHCVYLGVEPVFARLRGEGRFQALLARVGLPVPARAARS